MVFNPNLAKVLSNHLSRYSLVIATAKRAREISEEAEANGEIDGELQHLPPIITDDGGHGMIFKFGKKLMLTLHSPNQTGFERPRFIELIDTGKEITPAD